MSYLDHAATSWPKPDAVVAAVLAWYDEIGVSADRGDGPATARARTIVRRTRERLARRCGIVDDGIAFVSGATEGLNLVLRAVAAPGSRVLTTAFEHSSVVRPLSALAHERSLALHVLPPAADGGIAPEAVAAAIAAHRPDLFVFTHASNVTGTCFDARAFCAAASAAGCRTVLDASQTAGLWPLDVGADVVVASAHKAMHGPPGLGFVACRARDLLPQKHGGTGSSVALAEHPTTWPTAFEAGTPNTPAIFGLDAALTWLDEQGEASLRDRALLARQRLQDGLARLPRVRVLPAPPGPLVPVLSFTHEDYDPAELGALLVGRRVHARTGFHCAPWLHEPMGTAAAGTVRLSPGPATTTQQIDAVLDLFASL
jgi:cysteine desulfurase / selenocysteine lyase